MPRRAIIVDITGRDPNNLQESCLEWCDEHIREVDHLNSEEAAYWLLRAYLKTIHPNTTGSDALSVTVKDLPE